jgi:hypothetical protein
MRVLVGSDGLQVQSCNHLVSDFGQQTQTIKGMRRIAEGLHVHRLSFTVSNAAILADLARACGFRGLKKKLKAMLAFSCYNAFTNYSYFQEFDNFII